MASSCRSTSWTSLLSRRWNCGERTLAGSKGVSGGGSPTVAARGSTGNCSVNPAGSLPDRWVPASRATAVSSAR
jgi:hypothetical protein